MLLSEDNVYQVIKVYVVQMLHNQVLCTCYLLVLKLHKDVVPEIMDIYTPLSHLVPCPKPQKYRCVYICVCVCVYIYNVCIYTWFLKIGPPHQYSNTNTD